MKLHLDADTSMRALHEGLLRRGHDVTRTPCSWVGADATDEEQLLRATSQGRAVFTFNIRDYVALAQRHPVHGGIVLAAQSRWAVSSLISALDALLAENPNGIAGQVLWLSQPRPQGS